MAIMGGNVGIGTVAPSYVLDVSGEARADKWVTSSDARLKTNVMGIDGFLALNMLLTLRGVSYEWIDPARGDGRRFGMLAQEVEDVFPSWVSRGTDGYLALSYEGFQALAVESMRAMRTEYTDIGARVDETAALCQARYEELKAENAAINAQNAELQSRVKRLEKLWQRMSAGGSAE